MIPDILPLLIGTAAKWLVYTFLLWVMIKIQKLNYNVLGLLGSSAAAIAVSFIPYAGSYLSYVVLVLCLWKCTRADIAPDIIFTVAVAGALMFCFNLWALGALMGDLRPDMKLAARSEAPAADIADEDDSPQAPVPAAEPSSLTPSAETKKAPEASKPAAASQPGPAIAAATTEPALPPKAKGLALKGVSLQAAQPLAMIGFGTRVYTLSPGEAAVMESAQGKIKVRCEEVAQSSVVLTIDQTDKVTLRLQ